MIAGADPGASVTQKVWSSPVGSTSTAATAKAVIGPQSTQSFDLDRPLRDARDGFEKAYFEFHLAMENGSMTRVAEKTGLERTHLYRKLKQLGVDLSRGRRSAATNFKALGSSQCRRPHKMAQNATLWGLFIPSVPIRMGLSAPSFPRPTVRSPELSVLRAVEQ
eukprot:gene42170-57101_t